MNTKSIMFVAVPLVLLTVALAGALFLACEDDWCFVTKWQKVRAADSFERCVLLGFPVLESYPRQCRAGEKSFTETVPPIPEQAPPFMTAGTKIHVTAPAPNALIESPLFVSGEARGGWYFEASFPVRLLDANGDVLAALPAQAKGEWMTPEFVPFEALLAFDTPKTRTGTLVFAKDNPSGLPEHDASISIPVRFALHEDASGPMRTVELFYYNAKQDQDALGNIGCTSRGLVPVERTIMVSKTPIQNTIRLLLLGLIESGEREEGITTEYPLTDFELTSASLVDGILTLTFADPLNRTSGGACRSTILWSQIAATAKQFPGVREVQFAPVDLFQP